jgi:hypothetical protein
MEVYRGQTNSDSRYRGNPTPYIELPFSEGFNEFLLYLKLGNQPPGLC